MCSIPLPGLTALSCRKYGPSLSTNVQENFKVPWISSKTMRPTLPRRCDWTATTTHPTCQIWHRQPFTCSLHSNDIWKAVAFLQRQRCYGGGERTNSFSPWIGSIEALLEEANHTQGDLRREVQRCHSPQTTPLQLSLLLVKQPIIIYVLQKTAGSSSQAIPSLFIPILRLPFCLNIRIYLP